MTHPVSFRAARNIAKTLGIKAECGYLRKRDVPIESALYCLLGADAYRRFVDMEMRAK